MLSRAAGGTVPVYRRVRPFPAGWTF